MAILIDETKRVWCEASPVASAAHSTENLRAYTLSLL